MSKTVIKVENINKIYKLYDKPKDRLKEAINFTRKKFHRDFHALDNISLEISKGEIIGIIGKNGSGKSTLLKIITGVISPTQGKVTVNGKVSALLELGAGFNGEYTGIENIYLNGLMLGFTKEEMDRKLENILAFAEIGDFVYQPVKSYSSGMFARLAFSVAINVEPDILIVDEALAVGDLRFQLKCMDKFNELRVMGKTILFVTHDINSVKRYCHRVIWINEGKLIAEGHTETICDRYTDYLRYGNIEKSVDVIDKEDRIKVTGELDENLVGYIKSFKLYDHNNIEISELNHGRKAYVDIQYVMNRDDLENIVIGVAVHTLDDTYICGLNTLLDGKKLHYRKGLNRIRLEYENIPLLGGTYYFDAGLFEANAHIPIDYQSKIKKVFVNAPYVGEGITILPHNWILEGELK
jgi:teichoic acid transport system ATP-binding protein